MRLWRVLMCGAILSSTPALAQDNSLSFGAPAQNEKTPDVYVIQRGDTLWDISTKFLGNPYYWPRLWSINDYITNPHWIYPGNRIVFKPGSLLDPPGIGIDGGGGYRSDAWSFDSSEPQCGPDVRFDRPYETAVYTNPGFIAEKKDLESYGRITAAKTGMIKLSEGDRVYMELENANAVECGDVLAVYREKDKVRHPDKWLRKYGTMYDVRGEITVVHIDGDIAAGVVRTNYRPFNRGDLVGPLVPVRTEVPADAPRGDLEGVILAQLNEKITMLFPGETVFLDLGRGDGVKVGNSFYIVRRRDLVQNPDGWDEDIHAQVVGRVVVTRVDEGHSTATIVNAESPIKVGDRIAMSID